MRRSDPHVETANAPGYLHTRPARRPVRASVVALMVPVAHALLRPAGRGHAAAAAGIVTPAVLAYAARASDLLGQTAVSLIVGALALVVVFGVARTSCGWPTRPRADASSTSTPCSRSARSPASPAD